MSFSKTVNLPVASSRLYNVGLSEFGWHKRDNRLSGPNRNREGSRLQSRLIEQKVRPAPSSVTSKTAIELWPRFEL